MNLFEESRLATWFANIIAIGLILFALVSFWRTPDIVSLLILVGVGGISGAILAWNITPMIGAWCGNALFMPTAKLKRPPERLDRIRGLIQEHKFAEAVTDLNGVLVRDTFDVEARMLLLHVYTDFLRDPQSAVNICVEYFDHPGHASNRDSVEMLLFLSDILSAEDAVHYLKKELKRGKYSNYDRKILQARLQAIS